MTTTLREVLARRADDAGRPNLDLADLVGRGEARLRRRRLAEVASGAAAVVLVVGVAVGVALNGTVNRGEGPSITGPSPSVTRPSPSPTETLAAARQLLYIDVVRDSTVHVEGTVHFGDRATTIDNAFVFTDVTDDGFVYTSRDDLWFSDGEGPVQIGARVCGLPRNGIRHDAQDAVITGNAGSLVAWIECEVTVSFESPQHPTLVVYDTASRREIVREPCGIALACNLDGVIGEHIYVTQSNGSTRPEHPFVYDVKTARWIPATSRSFDDEVRNNPRGLVYGDTWDSATAGDGIRGWDAVGTRLVAIAGDVAKEGPTTVFDTATHHAVQLRLPPGYDASGWRFSVFEWLDDDTVALIPEHNLGSADIITCRLSEGRCLVAVKALPGTIRLAPTQSLPG